MALYSDICAHIEKSAEWQHGKCDIDELQSLKNILDTVKSENPFWQDWSLMNDKAFAASIKKKFSHEQITKFFAHSDTVKSAITKLDKCLNKVKAMYEARQAYT